MVELRELIDSTLKYRLSSPDARISNYFPEFNDWTKQTAAETSAGVTPVNYAYPPYNGLRYGIDPTGATVSTAALQAGIDAAIAGYHHTFTLPHGIIVIDDTIDVPEGLMIVGQGSQGSTSSYGTVILHQSNDDLFLWDGTGASAAGTGGGLKNVLILKDDGFSGGYAVNIFATDDNHRPGEMFLENILIFGTGSGLWERALNVDGTNCTTPGSSGVRSIVGHKVRVGDCSENNRYVSLENVVHCTFTHLQVDTGNGTGTVGMTIGSASQNVNLVGCIINGELDINDTATQINIQGRVGAFDQNNSICIGSFVGSTSQGIRNNSKLFRICADEADSVFSYRTTDATNVTGAGTTYQYFCTTESQDRNQSYDTTTGVYTSFCAGNHAIATAVTLDDLTVANTSIILNILHENVGGSTVNSIDLHFGSGANADSGGSLTLHASLVLDMNEGDTIKTRITVAGGAGDTVDVIGRANTRYTWFSGRLIA